MKALVINTPSRTVKLPSREGTRAAGTIDTVRTGETAQTLKAFSAIHRSKRFTAAAAHQAFAGVKRTK